MIDGQMMIPLRFKIDRLDDEESFDVDLPVYSITPTTYNIEIEVLDLRSLEPRTICFETGEARAKIDESTDLSSLLRADQRDYLRRLRDKIDEVLGA